MLSLPRRRLNGLALLFLLLMLPDRPALGADATPAPWMQPGSGDKYVFVGKSVWDMETGKMVSPTGSPGHLDRARPIVGISDRVFEPGINKGIPSMPGVGLLVDLASGARKMPTLDDKPPQDYGFAGYWVAPDHRRVVWMQNGDYWRGEVDWANVKIINRKQVTSLGAFTALNTPMLWWGNLLFVYGNFDKAKPIVRIDLVSGATDEMEDHRAFIGNANGLAASTLVSPSGCRVLTPTASVIYCYDARTGKPSMIRNKFEDIPSTRGRQLFVTLPSVWLDDDNVYSLDGQGYLAHIDLRNSRMDVIAEPEPSVAGAANARISRQAVIPGGRYVDIATTTGGGQGGPEQPAGRYLMDITTGNRVPFPVESASYGTWLDDNYYIYTVSTGGLSKVGTWAYDRASNSAKRLIGKAIDTQRILYLKKQKQLWSVSQQSGNTLVKMNLDGSGSQDLGPCEMMQPLTMPTEDPIDLGFGGATVDLWKAPVIDETAIAATQPPEPAAGKIKLIELTKDLPADQKNSAEQAYDYAETNGFLGNYCDPVKVALKVLEAYKANPSGGNPYAQMNFDDTADHDHIVRWAHDHTLEMIRVDTKISPDQKKAIADKVGPCVAGSYFKQPKPELRNIEILFQNCLNETRASVTGQPVAASNAPMPAPQQGSGRAPPQNNPATKPAQPQAGKSNADKAAQNAKRAKDGGN